jgi:hypothetical protein
MEEYASFETSDFLRLFKKQMMDNVQKKASSSTRSLPRSFREQLLGYATGRHR